MNTYIVYPAKTGKRIASGKAEECAQALGMKSKNVFWQTIRDVRDGKNNKYQIETFRPNGKPDSMRCPCDKCKKQPENKPEGAVSWSCLLGCSDWTKWKKGYWEGLNEKYGRR